MAKVPRLPHLKTQTFKVKVGEKEESKKDENGKFQNDVVPVYGECVIQEPDFNSLSMALTRMTGSSSGYMDYSGAGKIIFDLCCVECDERIEKNPQILLGLCLRLTNEYLDKVGVEIEKK